MIQSSSLSAHTPSSNTMTSNCSSYGTHAVFTHYLDTTFGKHPKGDVPHPQDHNSCLDHRLYNEHYVWIKYTATLHHSTLLRRWSLTDLATKFGYQISQGTARFNHPWCAVLSDTGTPSGHRRIHPQAVVLANAFS
jgi:hypothetical protein